MNQWISRGVARWAMPLLVAGVASVSAVAQAGASTPSTLGTNGNNVHPAACTVQFHARRGCQPLSKTILQPGCTIQSRARRGCQPLSKSEKSGVIGPALSRSTR